MPPKNKKQKPNAFMTFANEWKAQYAPPNWSLQRCIPDAGKLWEKMSMAEREPYMNKAKNVQRLPVDCDDKHKLAGDSRRNCMGDLIADIEKESKSTLTHERMNIRTIDKIIRQVVSEGKLESTRFYFIMVNYFTKSLSGDFYVPAEIGFAEFSLEGGVSRVYHSHINPGVNAFGQRYQTEKYVNDTHRLPLPPNALGEENLAKIYIDLLSFLDKSADSDGKLPPIYTTKDIMPIADNILKFMKDPCHPDVRILPIEYLFFVLKDETCKACGLDRPKTQFVTDAVFERDKFEHHQDIACQYHEDKDRSKYCAQSCVMRWGYTFADYICLDLAILLAPGTHMPNIKKSAFIIIEPTERTSYKRKRTNQSLKQETSQEFTDNSLALGPSSMQQRPWNELNENVQLKNEDLNSFYDKEKNVSSTSFVKTEICSDNELLDENGEILVAPPPPTNIFGPYNPTNIKQEESFGFSIDDDEHDLRNINKSQHNSKRSQSPRKRSSDHVGRLRSGIGQASRKVENDRRRSHREERQHDRDSLRRNSNRRSRSPKRRLNRDCSLSPIRNDRDRNQSPGRRFNRDRSRSPGHMFNRDYSGSPLRSPNRDRINSPLHNFIRNRSQSPIHMLDTDPMDMFNRDLNRSPIQQLHGTRFVNDNQPMMPINEYHSPLRNQMENFGERIVPQNVDHPSYGQWQRNCPPVHSIPFHSDQNIQQQHLQTLESQQQIFDNANVWQHNTNQSYGQLQNDFDNGNNIEQDIREYMQNQRVESSQSPIIQIIIPPEIRHPQNLKENDLRHHLKQLHGNNQRVPRNVAGNDQIDVGQCDPRMAMGNNQGQRRVMQRDPRMLDANNGRDGRTMQRDPSMLDGRNERDGRIMERDPRMIDGQNQREGRIMERDPRIVEGPNQREGRIMQRDPRMLDGNNHIEGRIMQHDSRMMDGHDPSVMVGRDTRMMDGLDPRMIDGLNPRMIDGHDPRMMHGHNLRMMDGHDPRMMDGHDPSMMDGHNPRIMDGHDPRMMDGHDPRIIDGHNARMMDGHNPRIMDGHDPRMMDGHDPRIIDGHNARMIDGHNARMMIGHDPRMMDGHNPRMIDGHNARTMDGHDPRMFDRNIERGPRNEQFDPTMLVRNGQREERNAPCVPRMNFENNQRMERDPGLINRDPRLIVGNDQGQPIMGQRDPRLLNGANQISPRSSHIDPSMIVGNNQYDPRFANRDPRNNQSDRGPRRDNDVGRFVRSEFGLGTSNTYSFL